MPKKKKLQNLDIFFKQSGLKILAIARFNSCEYSTLFYLLNCAVSGIEEVITTYTEFASLINYSMDEIYNALQNLEKQKIIKVLKNKPNNDTISLKLEFDPSKWALNTEKTKITTEEAIVFPFKKLTKISLKVLDGTKSAKRKASRMIEDNSWKRILDAYLKNRSLDEEELLKAQEDAKILAHTYPIDQVLLFIRYFKKRIPSLSLLASMWQHYEEMFEQETQKIDFINAKQKHLHMDKELRDRVKLLIESKDYKKLSEEEKTVLNIILKHRHPRRQLFWAYQEKGRYPNLTNFFASTSHLMLPITSTGKIFHYNHNNKDE